MHEANERVHGHLDWKDGGLRSFGEQRKGIFILTYILEAILGRNSHPLSYASDRYRYWGFALGKILIQTPNLCQKHSQLCCSFKAHMQRDLRHYCFLSFWTDAKALYSKWQSVNVLWNVRSDWWEDVPRHGNNEVSSGTDSSARTN